MSDGRRVLLVLALALCGNAAAAETAKPTTEFKPFLLSWEAGEGGALSLDPRKPSSFAGGVAFHYERVDLLCDRIEFTLSTKPGEERLIETAAIATGPAAKDPAHVILDSSRSELPEIGFRGIFRPSKVTVARVRADAVDPADIVRYSVKLDDVGAFTGSLAQSDRTWTPIAGWARSAELVLQGDRVKGGLANVRLMDIHLYGERGATKAERKPVVLMDLDPAKVPDVNAADVAAISAQAADDPARGWASRQRSLTFTVAFDGEAGYGGSLYPGSDWTVEGVPRPALDARKGKKRAVIHDE